MNAPLRAVSSELTELTTEYEILGELGRGGSAVVYHGRDRSLGRDVAIKVVHPRPLTANDDPVARLAREARTVAQLQHPNIVTVYAVRRLSGGGLALVMQLVPGRTLKEMLIEDGPCDPGRCRYILQDVAAALAYAHSRGVIHRDVKPENIFLDEESGRSLLSDFGIARSDEQDSMTMTGTAIGTPFYMSPEQIDGGAVDGRSDLYSLGLVAWEMLTGRRPWDGESLYSVISKQKHEQLPPIEALRSGVPLRLQYIIDRMLQKNAAARWAGADGLLAQLTHTVLPGDYARWQTALTKRVERYRLAERERAKTASEPVPKTGGLLASTIRFVRGVAGADPSAPSSAAVSSAPVSLADTMVVPREGMQMPPMAVAAVAAGRPEPTATVVPPSAPELGKALGTARPSWDLPSSRVPRAVWVSGAAAAAVLLAGTAAIRLRQTGALPSFGQLWSMLPHSVSFGGSETGAGTTAAYQGAPSGDAPPVVPPPLVSSRSSSTVVEPPRVVLSLGAHHSCAVAGNGTVNCWGANDRGQLGDGTAQQQLLPVRAAGTLSFSSVAAGAAHSCAVTSTGDIYCWGNDTSGELGDATTVRRNAPVRVAGPGIYRSVSSGDSHACAVTVQGSLDCWGSNSHGQLGDSTIGFGSMPGRVIGVDQIRFVQAVVGGAHSCALTADGSAYCWGANDHGQLGVAGPADRHAPTPVAGGLHFSSLSAGQMHTCGVGIDGAISCWGANGRGQLGNGSRVGANAPQSVRIGVAAAAVAAGGQHTCALTLTGDAFCWGANNAGQLGLGTAVDAVAPARVAAGEALIAISTGGTHTCAATRSGGILCWGDNSSGQLGDKSHTGHPLPTRAGIAAPIAPPPIAPGGPNR